MLERKQGDRDNQNIPEVSQDEFFASERSPSAAPQSISGTLPVQRQAETNDPPPTPSNHNLERLLAPRLLPEPSPLHLQAKLEIGAVGDRYEKEADRVAHQVVQRLHAPQLDASPKSPVLQRELERGYNAQTHPPIQQLQRKDSPNFVQAQFSPQSVLRNDVLQRNTALTGGTASAEFESEIKSEKGKGQPLEANMQQRMGQAMGADFSGVRVHTNGQSDRLNQSIQAKAFTTGRDIFFKRGAYQPGNASGQELIAHELTHVVQQNSDTVQARADGDRERLNAGRVPTVQASWIGKKNIKISNTTVEYRYWHEDKANNMDLDSGWYKRTNNEGNWSENNVVQETSSDVLNTLPNIVPPSNGNDPATRYENPSIDEQQYNTDKFHDKFAQGTMGKLSEKVAKKVQKGLRTTKSAQKFYRWGEYEYEKRYVKNNSFQLGSVNYGSTQFGLGLYISTTPWDSTKFASKEDGSILQVTVPKGVSYLNLLSQDGDVCLELMSEDKHSKVPQLLSELNRENTWACIRDDKISGLQIEFYRPSPKELKKVAPHLQGYNKTSTKNGYNALQIITRQMGKSSWMLPEQNSVVSAYINSPKTITAKLGAYLDKISRFEFVPFLLSKGSIDFSDDVTEFLTSFTATKNYKKTLGTLETDMKLWATQPFSLPRADFHNQILKPYQEQLEAYKKEHKKQKGNKLAKFVDFEGRLELFHDFLDTIEYEYWMVKEKTLD